MKDYQTLLFTADFIVTKLTKISTSNFIIRLTHRRIDDNIVLLFYITTLFLHYVYICSTCTMIT
jgi:hypothetical protein